MIVELPEWQPLLPGTPPWTPDASGAGRVVVLLAPAAARRDGWAVRMALDLTGAWSDAGRKVVLADGVLEYPRLHRELGLANTEGISDAALFGASVARVARPGPGRSFFLVSAGSPTGDPGSVATSPRWRRLLDGFKEAGVTLVLFLREGCAAEEDLAKGADDVLVLAGSGEDLPDGARRMADRVRLVVGPDAGVARAAQHDAPGTPAPDTPDPSTPEADAPDDPPWGAFGQGPDPFESIPEHAALNAAALSGAPRVDADRPEAGDHGEPEIDVTEHVLHMDEYAMDPGVEDLGVADPGAGDRVGDIGGREGSDLEPGDTPSGPSGDEIRVDPPAVGYTPSRPGPRKRGGADPHARRKLMWVGLVVLVLVVIVILGALR